MKTVLRITLALLILFAMQCIASADASQLVKWSQLPDMVNGYQFSSETKVPSLVADDWICPTEALAGLRWWGGLWTPTAAGKYSHYCDSRPTITSLGNYQAWIIRIFDNVPQSATEPYARPGNELAMWTLSSADVQETHYKDTQSGRHVHSYYADLTNLAMPQLTAGSIYWISIQAQMSDTNVQWGWHESRDHRLSAAVQDFKSAGWLQIQNNMYDNDMAFELTTIPEPTGLSVLTVGIGGMATFFWRRRR